MADPLATTTTAVAVGMGAIFFSAIGLEPQTLVYATVGAIFGAGTTPPSGRLRTIALFFAVILGAALLGTVAADYWHGGGQNARNVWAMGIGVSFHLLVASTLRAAPLFYNTILDIATKAKGVKGGDQQ